jgi:hypothetical protein
MRRIAAQSVGNSHRLYDHVGQSCLPKELARKMVISNDCRSSFSSMSRELTSFVINRSYQAHPAGCRCCRISTHISPPSSDAFSPFQEKRQWLSSTTSGSDDEGDASSNDSNNTQDSTITSKQTVTPPILAFPGLPGAQTGGKKLAIVFTCTICNTRSAKQFTEQAYRHGIVIVRCPGCEKQHLIADNLSMFSDSDEDGFNIETAMAKLGQSVTTVTDDNLFELTLEQIVGTEALKEATEQSKGDDDKSDKRTDS